MLLIFLSASYHSIPCFSQVLIFRCMQQLALWRNNTDGDMTIFDGMRECVIWQLQVMTMMKLVQLPAIKINVALHLNISPSITNPS